MAHLISFRRQLINLSNSSTTLYRFVALPLVYSVSLDQVDVLLSVPLGDLEAEMREVRAVPVVCLRLLDSRDCNTQESDRTAASAAAAALAEKAARRSVIQRYAQATAVLVHLQVVL